MKVYLRAIGTALLILGLFGMFCACGFVESVPTEMEIKFFLIFFLGSIGGAFCNAAGADLW